jgi:anaerobic magnesium-protoporphyrin IX monomethyl ester cyclase
VRILLINPPSPERLGAPLLGLQYVAASLLHEGCEVRVVDAAARHFTHGADWIVEQVRNFEPDLVGVALFTRWIWHAYRLVERLRDIGAVLVAGGAHTTVCPEETLARGFHFALTGEAEQSMVALVRALRDGGPLDAVPGLYRRDATGHTVQGPPAAFIEDLDALAEPHCAQHLFDPLWYDPSGRETVPGGVLTSRGCPARCTFCANVVTGRGFRFRSAANVVAELNALHARDGSCFFPFWDDALTAKIPRLNTLCETIERSIQFPLRFSAITRATLVTPDLLRTMKRAGLVHVNFGVESGDDAILRIIKKGIKTEHVVRALEWAKAEGLQTACNFMLGFPEDSPVSLERTARFMERIAPLVDTFSTLGVVVPFPGTPLYEDHHVTYGFTEWWLDERYSHYAEFPPVQERHRFNRFYIDDSNLDVDFFRYDTPTREMIRECLRLKGEHNLRRMGLMSDPVFAPDARPRAAALRVESGHA